MMATVKLLKNCNYFTKYFFSFEILHILTNTSVVGFELRSSYGILAGLELTM